MGREPDLLKPHSSQLKPNNSNLFPMKPSKFLSAALFSLSGILFLACSQDKSPQPGVGKPVHVSSRVADQTNDFAFDLTRNLYKTEPAGDNIFVSPLSLHIALGMLLNGAEGETRDGILKALKAEESSVEALNEAYTTLLKELPAADNKVKLDIANAVWTRKNFAVKPGFHAILKEIFDSEAYEEPFDQSTVDKINHWASEKTQGKIQKVIDEISDDHVMFLMNALYFKGDWKYAFDQSKTRDWDFQLAGGGSKKVKMMLAESDFRTLSTEDYSVVELPYSSGQFNLTLFVPHQAEKLTDLLEKLDHAEWEKVQQQLSVKGLKVGLPKFRLDYEIQLGNVLAQMGMSRAFSDAAQFGKISDHPLLVSFVKQNTFLGIDEEGTEAAAVTTIGIGTTSTGGTAKPAIIADRPFFFIISEKTSKTILFTGRIMNP